MITDKDLQDRFERLPKWAQDELEARDRMIKSLTDELMETRGEVDQIEADVKGGE